MSDDETVKSGEERRTRSFRDIVREVMRLTARRDEESARIKCQHFGGHDPHVYTLADLMQMTLLPHPARAALCDYLLGLDLDTVRKLQQLMYAGRGDGTFTPGFHAHLVSVAPALSIIVACMVGKSPLATYLAHGLTRADAEGVDLERSVLIATRVERQPVDDDEESHS